MVKREDRFHKPLGSGVGATDIRTQFAKDRDRILYSTNFQRLARVTQVVGPNERHLIHNRLTHSLEVAQIGRGLAEALIAKADYREAIQAAGGLVPEVVEAAALAHDLGHPPFGHVAESILNSALIMAGASEGFEGNAQSFRIITKLGVRYRDTPGLNLTRATLNAVLKYPWKHGESRAKPNKWGAYETESDDLVWARELMPSPTQSVCIEAGLMDWADDVAYAVHDLDDFYRAGLIPLDRLTIDSEEQSRFLAAEFNRNETIENEHAAYVETFEHLADLFPVNAPYQGTRSDRAAMRSFTSSLIGDYINAVSVEKAGNGLFHIAIDPEKEREVKLLKGLTWHYVINSPSLVSQRYGQSKLIQSLFETLWAASANERDRFIFPPFFQDQFTFDGANPDNARIVADYIASMSEAQAVEIHQRLTGQSLGSGIDRVQ